jgi:nucleoid DNA-binding protein
MVSLQDVAREVYLRIDQGTGSIPQLRKSGVFEIIKATFDVMGQALASGEDIIVSHFGKFQIKTQKERQGVNPSTKEKILIPKKKALKFKVSSALKVKVGELSVD